MIQLIYCVCVQKQLKDLASLAQKKIKEEAFGKKMMEENVYTEAVKGNMYYFFEEKLEEQNQDNTFVCQVAPDGSNILHVAIQHKRVEFAKKVMTSYPHLIWERDYNGDTPLHTAAKLWDINDCDLNHSYFKDQWEKACRSYHDSPSQEGLLIIPPWRVKNSQGNVPLHEKANSPVDAFGFHLLTFDFEAATYVNSVGDTPLHISAKESFSFFTLGGKQRTYHMSLEIIQLLVYLFNLLTVFVRFGQQCQICHICSG